MRSDPARVTAARRRALGTSSEHDRLPLPAARDGRSRRAFLAGLTTPSPLAVVVMVMTMVLLLGACCVIMTPTAIAGGMWRLLSTSAYETPRFEATARWLDLRRRPPRSPAVLVVGSSAIQEAFLPNLFERELGERLGRPLDIRPLLMPGITAWEMVALVDLLPPATHGVLALGFGFHALARRRGQRPGGLLPVGAYERALRQRLGARLREPTGIYFLDRFRALAPRVPHMLRQLVLPSPVPPRRVFSRRELSPNAATAAILAAHWMSAAELEDELERTEAVLEEVIGRLTASGRLRVVLMEPPYNREAASRWLQPEVPAAYRRTFDAIMAATGVAEIPVSREAGLTAADFLDVSHLDPAGSGAERFTTALARDLAGVLQALPEAGE